MRSVHRMTAVAGSVPKARRFAHGFALRFAPQRVEDLETIVSELVTNVVRHAGPHPDQRIDLTFERAKGGVRVSVEDAGPGFDALPSPPTPDQTSGWGLHLVDRLADGWGFSPSEDGFRVWALVLTDGGGAG